MPTWLKIVLGILVGSVIICGGAFGACALFVKHKSEEFKSDMEASKSMSQDACMPEGLKKVKECDPDGVLCIGKTSLWTASCFQQAQPSPGFCDSVPVNGPAAEAWQQETCKSYGLTADKKGKDGRCGAILVMVVQHCIAAHYDGGSGMGNQDEGNTDDQDKGNDEPPSDDTKGDEKTE